MSEKNKNIGAPIDFIGRDLLSANDRVAQHIRDDIRKMGSVLIHLTSSPGSGKTTLLEATVKALDGKFSIGAIEGDVATENDAARMLKMGIPSQAIITHGACHLDAKSVRRALDKLTANDKFDLIFVENVGNLVCPSGFDLGEDHRVVLISVAEGDDKPEKYPPIFRKADTLIVSKLDLLPYVDFDVEKVKNHARAISPNIRTFELSSKNGEGMDKWVEWLGSLRAGE